MGLCVSGGALGADLLWGEAAQADGQEVMHLSFEGHRTEANENNVVRLSLSHLEKADLYLKRANLTIKRKLPFDKPSIINLLRRNFWQIWRAESVYAISTFKDGLVQGGTAWAVVMFLNQNPDTETCYVFDQDQEKWFRWDAFYWKEVIYVPKPSGIWAGIGTREINQAGKNALKDLFK
jgi:hypothetical protein